MAAIFQANTGLDLRDFKLPAHSPLNRPEGSLMGGNPNIISTSAKVQNDLGPLTPNEAKTLSLPRATGMVATVSTAPTQTIAPSAITQGPSTTQGPAAAQAQSTDSGSPGIAKPQAQEVQQGANAWEGAHKGPFARFVQAVTHGIAVTASIVLSAVKAIFGLASRIKPN